MIWLEKRISYFDLSEFCLLAKLFKWMEELGGIFELVNLELVAPLVSWHCGIDVLLDFTKPLLRLSLLILLLLIELIWNCGNLDAADCLFNCEVDVVDSEVLFGEPDLLEL